MIEQKDTQSLECEGECEAWRQVAIESFQAIDRLCRKVLPDLPVHYGMPQDAVRLAFRALGKHDDD